MNLDEHVAYQAIIDLTLTVGNCLAAITIY
jgi:hypothetical protein